MQRIQEYAESHGHGVSEIIGHGVGPTMTREPIIPTRLWNADVACA